MAPTLWVSIVALLGLAAASCSGGGGSSATTAGEAAPSSSASTSTTTSSPATTTTDPGPPVYPLTGLPADDPAIASRPALVVKIDNHPEARPQSGLGAADLVFEENVEKLTRFAAVFQSGDADPVGPIRSGRTQDVMLLGSLNRPLFAWSGGNANVTDIIERSDLVDLSALKSTSKGAGYHRSDAPVPHNLYATTTGLFSLAPVGAEPPSRQFGYRRDGEVPAGSPSAGVDVAMDGVAVGWDWSEQQAEYLRTQGGAAHRDASLGQISAANVVVMFVDYQPSPADAKSPEAQTIGRGEVWVLTGGNLVRGTWQRADRLDPIALVDGSGAPIGLTPGRTWIELARVGSATQV